MAQTTPITSTFPLLQAPSRMVRPFPLTSTQWMKRKEQIRAEYNMLLAELTSTNGALAGVQARTAAEAKAVEAEGQLQAERVRATEAEAEAEGQLQAERVRATEAEAEAEGQLQVERVRAAAAEAKAAGAEARVAVLQGEPQANRARLRRVWGFMNSTRQPQGITREGEGAATAAAQP